MPTRFHEKFAALLKTDVRFLDAEGELIPPAITGYARQFDGDLIRLLLADADIKAKFFEEIAEHWVFDVFTFIDYVSDKNFLDNSYTRFHNRIGLRIDDKFLRERGEVSLVWPYKDCVLEGGQTEEEQKRKEIFFNEILAQDEIDRLFDPKVLTGWKQFTANGEQEVAELKRDEGGTIQENLIIKGNNLLALHTLKRQFRSTVKLIYIDPPYNTGSDSFGYSDRFSHSSWLTFMKNRLQVARELLRHDGVLFIHIGDQEMHYLKVLADEVFGRDNFIATIPRKTRSGKSDVPYKLSQDFDWMLIYAKGASKKDALFSRTVNRKYHETPDFPGDKWRLTDLTTQRTVGERPNSDFTLVNPRNGQEFEVNPERCWSVTKDSVGEFLGKNKIVFPGDYDFLNMRRPAMRVFMSEEVEKRGDNFDKAYVSSDFLNRAMDELLKKMSNKQGTDEMMDLFGKKAFAYPKPELLIQRIIEYTTTQGDIVLDFHLGSGTTCAVAHKMGRQYIGIEQMNYMEEIPLERLKKVVGRAADEETTGYDTGGISESVNWQGGGEFIYFELMQYNQVYLEKIRDALTSEAVEELWRTVAENSFLNWYVNSINPADAIEDFRAIGQNENGLAKQKKTLIGLLNKNQLYVNLSDIRDEEFAISQEDKELNAQFYSDLDVNGEVE